MASPDAFFAAKIQCQRRKSRRRSIICFSFIQDWEDERASNFGILDAPSKLQSSLAVRTKHLPDFLTIFLNEDFYIFKAKCADDRGFIFPGRKYDEDNSVFDFVVALIGNVVSIMI